MGLTRQNENTVLTVAGDPLPVQVARSRSGAVVSDGPAGPPGRHSPECNRNVTPQLEMYPPGLHFGRTENLDDLIRKALRSLRESGLVHQDGGKGRPTTYRHTTTSR
ncbi:hypothetical protein GCM10022251_19840 [Phytohabitans flavus]